MSYRRELGASMRRQRLDTNFTLSPNYSFHKSYFWWWQGQVMTEVDWYLSERYDSIHWSAVDWISRRERRWEKRIWWSMVFKAAGRSNNSRTKILSLSREERMLCTTHNKMVSELWPAWYADWKSRGCFLEDGKEVCEVWLFKGFWAGIGLR